MKPAHLASLLERTGRRTVLAEAVRASCLLLAAILAAVVGALLLDTLLAPGGAGLVIVDLLLVVVVIGAFVRLVRHVHRHVFPRRRLARLIEARAGMSDSRLINAIDLADAPPAGASPSLVDAAVARGEAAADEVSPRAAIDAKSIRRAGAAAALGVLAAVIIHLTLPGVYGAVAKRLLDPTGGHAPYTMLHFDVAVDPEAVHHGRPATIHAAITGPGLPEQADLVFVDGDEDERVPLLRSGDSTDAERVFVLRIDRVEAPRDFYIDTESGRSGRYRLDVLPVPLIERVQVRYEFPSYTGWGQRAAALGAEGISGLAGTRVVVSAASNLPLSEGWIELHAGAGSRTVRLEPEPDDPAVVVGGFDLTGSGTFELGLTGADGTASDATVTGPVVATPDGPPAIEFVQPAPQLAAPESSTIDVIVRARDDVGIGRITLHRAVNGWGPTPVDLPLVSDRPGRAEAASAFDLAALGARAGDVITYSASAWDNHPDGEQFTETPTYVIQVITEAEYLDLARSQYRMEELTAELEWFQQRLEKLGDARERLLEELESLREKAAAGEALTLEEQARLEEFEAALTEFADEARELAEVMAERAQQDPLYEFEKPYQEMLETLAEQLEQQAANADEAAGSMPPVRAEPSDRSARRAMGESLENFRRENAPFDAEQQQERERTQEDLAAIAQADELVAEADRIRTVVLQQRDVADRLAEFRNGGELEGAEALRAHRLAERQEQLREELEAARIALQEAAGAAQERLPKMSEQAMGLCNAIAEMGVASDQAAAARAARAGAGRDAHDAAERAAVNLEKLLSDCDGSQMQGAASDELDGCLSLPKPNLREGLRQLAGSREVPGLGTRRGSGSRRSMARMGSAGPRPASGGESDAESGRLVESPHGAWRKLTERRAGAGVEHLTPGASTRIGRGSGGDGVPIRFREQAEAYFRRLAEDARKGREER